MGISKVDFKQEDHDISRNKEIQHYKDVIYQCGKCGTCRTVFQDVNWARVCPSGEFGKFEPYYLGGKNLLTWAITSNKIKWTDNLAKIFYHCSLCLACTQQCQIPEIHAYAGEWLMAMREEAVKLGYGPMPEHIKYTNLIFDQGNPYGEKRDERLDWLPNDIVPSKSAKMAYFIGCTSSYREQNIAISTISLLNSLNDEFQILKNESCCGSPVYMTGQVDKAKEIAEMNMKKFENAGTEKILTSCAGCYRMLKDIYPKKFDLNHDIEVVHLPEFLLEKLKNGELKLTKNLNIKLTYHDPCHIGRHMGLYKPPRELIQNLPGVELVEMPRNRHNAWCCGSGGGVRSTFKNMSAFAANERIEEAKITSAEAIVSCCPFCLNQFKTNIKADEIKALDISELIKKAL